MVYCLCVSIGEMIAFLYVVMHNIAFSATTEPTDNPNSPNVGGVVGLADLFVDPALGFSLGWAAWVSAAPCWTFFIRINRIGLVQLERDSSCVCSSYCLFPII